VGLCIALFISGLTNIFLCKPVMLSHCLVGQGKHKVMKECSACCAPPAAQANHMVLMQRQPQRVLQPLPLPLRQYLELDQLPAPTYKVPSLVSLPGPAEHGLTASMVAAKEWLHSRIAYQLQQLASANVSTKVLALWLLSMPFIMMAATFYQAAAEVSFREAMYKVSRGQYSARQQRERCLACLPLDTVFRFLLTMFAVTASQAGAQCWDEGGVLSPCSVEGRCLVQGMCWVA
jgi:hypothetical protein